MSKISKKRKATYYFGMGMIILGFILFVSVFFIGIRIMNDPFNFNKVPPFQNSVIGIILIIVGSFLTNIGAKGAAGSGFILDPDQAREDLQPFNEAKGKMINDVISNIEVADKIVKSGEEKQIIKIKCRYCGCLNDEDARFCKGCGKEI